MYLDEEKMKYMESDLCITDAILALFDDVKISADHSDLSHNPSKVYHWTCNLVIIDG